MTEWSLEQAAREFYKRFELTENYDGTLCLFEPATYGGDLRCEACKQFIPELVILLEEVERRPEARLRAETLKDWTPTAANINRLPYPVRAFIHDLETRCDPAGDVRALIVARDTARALEVELARMRAEVAGAEAELARLKGALRQNNLRGMLLHLLDGQWARISSRPRGTAEKGFGSFTREDVHDILRVIEEPREVASKEEL